MRYSILAVLLSVALTATTFVNGQPVRPPGLVPVSQTADSITYDVTWSAAGNALSYRVSYEWPSSRFTRVEHTTTAEADRVTVPLDSITQELRACVVAVRNNRTTSSPCTIVQVPASEPVLGTPGPPVLVPDTAPPIADTITPPPPIDTIPPSGLTSVTPTSWLAAIGPIIRSRDDPSGPWATYANRIPQAITIGDAIFALPDWHVEDVHYGPLTGRALLELRTTGATGPGNARWDQGAEIVSEHLRLYSIPNDYKAQWYRATHWQDCELLIIVVQDPGCRRWIWANAALTAFRWSGPLFGGPGSLDNTQADARTLAIGLELIGAADRSQIPYANSPSPGTEVSPNFTSWKAVRRRIAEQALALQDTVRGGWPFIAFEGAPSAASLPQSQRPSKLWMEAELVLALWRVARFAEPDLVPRVNTALARWASWVRVNRTGNAVPYISAWSGQPNPNGSPDLNTYYLVPLLLAGDTMTADALAQGTGNAYLGVPTNFVHLKHSNQYVNAAMAVQAVFALRRGVRW